MSVGCQGGSSITLTAGQLKALGISTSPSPSRSRRSLGRVATRSVPSCQRTVGLMRVNHEHHRGELGYDLARRWWGKGLVPEAAAAVVAYGFAVMGLHRIEAGVLPGKGPPPNNLAASSAAHLGVPALERPSCLPPGPKRAHDRDDRRTSVRL
jgi:Acetyltransferase (GNAT) domain